MTAIQLCELQVGVRKAVVRYSGGARNFDAVTALLRSIVAAGGPTAQMLRELMWATCMSAVPAARTKEQVEVQLVPLEIDTTVVSPEAFFTRPSCNEANPLLVDDEEHQLTRGW